MDTQVLVDSTVLIAQLGVLNTGANGCTAISVSVLGCPPKPLCTVIRWQTPVAGTAVYFQLTHSCPRFDALSP